uniref:Armadillo like helical domain containing 4 n=1 Tax=Ictidomys tridecemlineatus TaxID=43179 RepID=I3ML61_ICTTR
MLYFSAGLNYWNCQLYQFKAHFSFTMSRPIVLSIFLAFCSLLFLNFATQCLAFPKMERRELVHVRAEEWQPERMNTDDLENTSITPKQTPQLVFSEEDQMVVSTGPSAVPVNEVLLFNKETHPTGTGLQQPDSPGLSTVTEPVVPAGDQVFGSSQPEKMSPESRLSKIMLTVPITETASLNTGKKEEPLSSTSIQPIAEGTTEATPGFVKYVNHQLFVTENQDGVSLGDSPSSLKNAKEMTEKSEADMDQRTTSFPGAESGSLLLDGEKLLQKMADHTQATATEHLLVTSEYALSVGSETDSLLGAPEVTESVSRAVPAASILSDEWDDTKLESVSQIRTPMLEDNTDTQVRMEPLQTESQEGMEEGQPLTEAAEVSPGLPEEETDMGTALLIAQGEKKSPTFIDQSSFTPIGLMEDSEVFSVHMFQNMGGFEESTKENSAMFLSETTVSISEYESEAYQLLGNALKDIVTQEMTTATQEPEATLSLVTPEQVTRDSEETEEGKESPLLASDVPGVTQLSRQWEPLATTVSTTAIPWSPKVTPAAEDLTDTVTGPSEDLALVLGSLVTPPGIMVEVPSISPTFPALERTVPSVSGTNTAASYGLDQLESEEGEEDDDEEDEEDEEEEEEDEEEDEEDKDADSLDESFDGDSEVPSFTLPGITSQEPGLEQGNMDPLEGATYQVPDAIEWEQQNQGLVRSWMEKLKDKAGYMSGMLVPVGVGIAGALFILGALYSIKVMNRQRRNGFKRHKRKQREFNSMQDRVMLLADSSEDEF